MNRCQGRWGLYFRAARKRAGMSQVAMARYLGQSQSWLSKIENGILVPHVPEFLKVRRVANRVRRSV